MLARHQPRYQTTLCGSVSKSESIGSSVIGFGDQLTDEEIWAIIQYECSFSGSHIGPGDGISAWQGSL